MAQEPLNVAVIIGSARDGRFCTTVANWLLEQLKERPDLTVDVIDVADLGLPLTQQSAPTVFGVYEADEVNAFAERIARADAAIVVTPEYNHGYPAALKLAIDSISPEWNAKPIAFVSYGGNAGGQRSVDQLRQVFGELHAVSIRETVSFVNFWELFDEDGRPKDTEGPAGAVTKLTDQLLWWGHALRDARARSPYPN